MAINKDLITAMEDFERIISRADDLIDEMRMVNNRMKDRLQTIKWAADKSSKNEISKAPCSHPSMYAQATGICPDCGELLF